MSFSSPRFVRSNGFYYLVLESSSQGVLGFPSSLSSLDELWSEDIQMLLLPLSSERKAKATFLSWQILENPLVLKSDANSFNLKVLALGMTYPSHQKEIQHSQRMIFRKMASPEYQWGQVVPFHKYLDFELEVGVLLPPFESSKRGFILVNDWTLRDIQVERYQKENPILSFEQSKSFPSSLGVGPILAIADINLNAKYWKSLTATLSLVSEGKTIIKQRLKTSECTVEIDDDHLKLMAERSMAKWTPKGTPEGTPEETPKWTLISTGTPGGTLFQMPNLFQKLRLFIRSGFSSKRARRKLLDSISWLKPEDQIVIESEELGYVRSQFKESLEFHSNSTRRGR